MIQFVKFDDDFFVRSKYWLSDPTTKRLTLTPDISDADRKQWYTTLQNRSDYLIWGIMTDGIPIGAVGIKNIDYSISTGEYWGYIGEASYIGRGIGKCMMAEMMNQAKVHNLKKLVLKVADYNERAINLYNFMGFIEDGRESMNGYDLIYMSKEL